MNSKNTGEEARVERAEEEKALEATVDHERLARLVMEANYSPVHSQPPYSSPPLALAPAGKKSSVWLIVIVLTVIILLGASYFMSTVMRKSWSASPPNQPTNVNNRHDGTNNNGPSIIKREMVLIPGGTFQMGRNDGPRQEAPAHSVTVGDFFMDNTEVTNAEYAEFVRNTNHGVPTHWLGTAPPTGIEQWPVVNVSLDDAAAFAAWRSIQDGVAYRLPTEEEWEYAARSGGQHRFPWGESWEENRAVVKEVTPRPVGSYPEGRNRWGVFDLIGNVWEWTSSKASVYRGNPVVVPSQFKDWQVIRGGSYTSDEASGERPITATYRDWLAATTKAPQLGFRLVRTGP